MARVTIPGYSGKGAGGITFRDGVAETDNPGVLAYYARRGADVYGPGYGIDEAPALPLDGETGSVGPVVHPPGADPGPNGEHGETEGDDPADDPDEVSDDPDDEHEAAPAKPRKAATRKG